MMPRADPVPAGLGHMRMAVTQQQALQQPSLIELLEQKRAFQAVAETRGMNGSPAWSGFASHQQWDTEHAFTPHACTCRGRAIFEDVVKGNDGRSRKIGISRK